MIQLRTLGSLDLRRGEKRLDRVLAQPKRTALLVYLAVAKPHGFHTRDALIALLWPESDRRRGRRSLRKTLHFLRRHLGAEAIQSRGDDLGLAWDRVWCDANAFDEAQAAARARDALELYQGELLPGFHVSGAPDFERWLDRERPRLRRSAVRFAWTLAEEEEAAGNGIEAARLARRATALAPLEEAGHRRLMELLDRLGDRAGALRHFEVMSTRLREELELEPSRETLELARRIRDEEPGIRHPERRPAKAHDADPTHGPTGDSDGAPDEHPTRSHSALEEAPADRGPVRLSLAAGAILVLTLVVAVWSAVRSAPEGPVADSGRDGPAVLAVLPFENLIPDGESESWVVAGLHEQVIHELMQLPDLRVISRASVLPYLDSDLSKQQIAEQLGAHIVLDGGVRRDGSRLRATLQLTDAASGQLVWSEEFDATLGEDFIETQTEVALRVARTLTAALPPARRSWSVGASTEPDALRAYLRGRYLWKNLGSPPAEQAATLFRQALEIDPDFALAWASLAEGSLASAHFGVPPHVAFPRADSAAVQALAREPDLAEAHIALADTRFHYDWNWEAAERGFRRGITLKPSHATAHWWYAGLLAARGRSDEAVEQIERARILDPLSPIVDAFGARVLYWGREYDAAEERARHAIELAPNSFYAWGILGFTHLQQGRPEDALAAFRRSVELSDKFLPGLAVALARTGRTTEAFAVVARLEAMAAERYVAPYERALAYLAVGRRDKALDLVEEATRTRDAELIWIGVDAAYDDLRGEPRFEDVLRRMDLLDVSDRALQTVAEG